jgi:hypothetical protein
VNISITDEFLESTLRLHPADTRRVATFLDKLLHSPDAAGLRPEPIHDAPDRSVRSFKVTHDLRAIGRMDSGAVQMLHVGQHDQAYRWAREHCVDCHDDAGELRVIEDPARRVCTTNELCTAFDESGIEHGLAR